MLKLKDSVDFKKLKKYGFENNKGVYEQNINGNWWDIRGIDIDRELYHLTEEMGYWASTDDDELLKITFADLIKDDLIEELEEK